MLGRLSNVAALAGLVAALAVGCAPAQRAQPTAPAAKPAETAAKPAAPASPAASPVASPAASPGASPAAAAKPSGALPPKPADFPTGPIQFWVGFPAGGSTDVGARILAAAMEQILGQPVTVVNKAGGSGQAMWTELVRAKPDGSVIGMLNVPQLQTTILDPERQAPFKLEDFTPIANQVLDPGAIFVPKNSKYKTIEDLVQAAKQRPGQITAGDTGIGSDDHLAILDFEQKAGIDLRIVHFEGGAPMNTALFGGQIEVGFHNVGEFTSRVKAGDGSVLAVMDERRSPFLPESPTLKEKGWDVVSYSARGIGGPKGMKPEHVRYLAAVIERAMASPDVTSKLDEVGLQQQFMGAEEYGKFLRDQMERAQRLFTLIEEERKQG